MEVEKIVIVESQKKLKICVHVPESYTFYFVTFTNYRYHVVVLSVQDV